MEDYIRQLQSEYPKIQQDNNGEYHVKSSCCKHEILIRDYQNWWTERGDFTQDDFKCAPHHVTTLSNAFQIITDGYIKPNLSKKYRMGSSYLIYFGFPDFTKKNESVYGTVSFTVPFEKLYRTVPQFHYRYTARYNVERSHIFLLSNVGDPLPKVALRAYPKVCLNNGIWWLTEDAESTGATVHFRKEYAFEYIEFAVLKQGADDSIPLSGVSGIQFHKKYKSYLGNDSPGFNQSGEYLILALALHYEGAIPDNLMRLLVEVNPANVQSVMNDLLQSFTDLIPTGEKIENPFANIGATIDQAISPVQLVCKKLGKYIANQASVRPSDITFSDSIHYLRRKNSWILSQLHQLVVHFFRLTLMQLELAILTSLAPEMAMV
jgi:hypothetical protein